MKNLGIICLSIIVLCFMGCRERAPHMPLPALFCAPASIAGVTFHALGPEGSGIFPKNGLFSIAYESETFSITCASPIHVPSSGTYTYSQIDNVGTVLKDYGEHDGVLKIVYIFTSVRTGTYCASMGTRIQKGTFYMDFAIPSWRWLSQ